MRVFSYRYYRFLAWSALVAATCIFAASESVHAQGKGKGKGGGNQGGGAAQRSGQGRGKAGAARAPGGPGRSPSAGPSRGPSDSPAARAPSAGRPEARPAESRAPERPRTTQPGPATPARPDLDRTPDRGPVEVRRPSFDERIERTPDSTPDRGPRASDRYAAPDRGGVERDRVERDRDERFSRDERDAVRDTTRDARESARDTARDAARRAESRFDERDRRDDGRDFRSDIDRRSRTVDRATREQRERIQESLRRAVRASENTERSLVRWDERNRDRIRDWENRADRIRDRYRRDNWRFYDSGWWGGRNNIIGLSFGRGYGSFGFGNIGWGYQPWLGYRPYGYWWGRPSWVSLVGWMPWGWRDPYYYHYGPGGNVIYRTDYVYVNGQPVATPESYYESAVALADVDPRDIDPADRDWQPLGTFTMAVRDDEVDPDRVLQLAVNKEGLISGTVFNRRSGNLYTVQGRVDPDTQRAAFTIGDDTDTVLETGMYNLTQDQTTVLVHFNPRQTDTYMLARLPAPEELDTRAADRPLPEIAR